jgi:hypothetical protein
MSLIQKSLNIIMYRLPVGPMFWWSDAIASPPATPGRVWIFPPWFPQKAYIVGVSMGQQEPPDGKAGQFSIGIDRGGLSALNALPPYYQAGGDLQWDDIGSFWTGGNQEFTPPDFSVPKLLDRGAGDRLWIQNDVQAYGTDPNYRRTLWWRLKWMVDETWVPPTPVGWTGVFGPMVMESSLTGWNGYTIAQAIHADWFASGAGTKTRVTIAADSISAAYIGPRVPNTACQTSSMQQLTFGGNPGATAVGGLIVSDAMNFGIPTNNGIVVKFYINGNTMQYREINPSAQSYYKLGNDASTTSGTGYSASTNAVNGIVNIEQFY